MEATINDALDRLGDDTKARRGLNHEAMRIIGEVLFGNPNQALISDLHLAVYSRFPTIFLANVPRYQGGTADIMMVLVRVKRL